MSRFEVSNEVKLKPKTEVIQAFCTRIKTRKPNPPWYVSTAWWGQQVLNGSQWVASTVVAYTLLHHEQSLASTHKPAFIVLSGAACSAEGLRPELEWMLEYFEVTIAILCFRLEYIKVSDSQQCITFKLLAVIIHKLPCKLLQIAWLGSNLIALNWKVHSK